MTEYSSVWDALHDDKEHAENLRIRSDLMICIAQFLKDNNLTQQEASELFDVPQPRLSNIISGKIDKFTIDALVNILTKTGAEIDFSVHQPAEVEEEEKKIWSVGSTTLRLLVGGNSEQPVERPFSPAMLAVG